MDNATTDLNELLSQLPADDPQVIEALVNTYQGYLYALCCSILDDPAEAEDAAQETLIRAVQALGKYQPGTQVKSWLSTIAVNLCRDQLRRQRARRSLQRLLEAAGRLVGHTPGVEEHLLQSEARLALWRGVHALDEKHRLPVILRFVHGMTTREIATVLGVSEGTVHSRLHYALLKLQTVTDPAAESSWGDAL